MKDYITDVLRRVEILGHVLNKAPYSRLDYAVKFEVSEITISRDLQWMRSPGIPIYSKNNTISLSVPPDASTLNNLLANYLPLKLNSSVYDKPIEQLSKLNKQIYYQALTLIANAVSNQSCIRLTYQRLGDDEFHDYELIPVKLYLSNLDWVVDAFKAEETIKKKFYISRIQKISELGKKFSVPVIQESDDDKERIVLRFSARVRAEVVDKIWFDEYEICEMSDGDLILTTNQTVSHRLAAWCISWWDKLVIEEPQSLKDFIAMMYEQFRKSNNM